MKVGVYYHSRTGNTKKVGDAIGKAVGVNPMTTDADMTENLDILFIGGGTYAGNIDNNLRNFVSGLSPEKTKAVAVFSTSATGKSILPKIEELLNGKGIKVYSESFASKGKFLLANRNKPDEDDLLSASNFAKQILSTVN